MKQPPHIGAAITSDYLDQYRDWLIQDQRDLEIQDFCFPHFLDDDTLKSRVQNIKSMLDGYTGRLGLHAPFWNLTMAAYDRKIRAVVVDRYKQTLDICGELGGTHMVVHSPLDFLGAPSSLSNPTIENAPFFGIVHDTMAEVLPLAESIGCTLVIENIFDRLPTLLTDLVKSFDSPYVRQSLDVGHAYINTQVGAPPPDYWVRETGPLLEHVHLQDTDGYSDRHWTVGKGRVEWYALFEAIGELEHTPRLLLELSDQNTILQSVAWLQEHGLGC